MFGHVPNHYSPYDFTPINSEIHQHQQTDLGVTTDMDYMFHPPGAGPTLITQHAMDQQQQQQPQSLLERDDDLMVWEPLVPENKNTRYLALDTNIFISHLNAIRTIHSLLADIQPPPFIFLVPSVVIHELDGLKSSRELQTPDSPVDVGRLARTANLWLLTTHRTRREGGPCAVRCQALKERHDPKIRASGNGDDQILDCCLYFEDHGANVMLWTDDRNLSVKAETNNIPTIGCEDLTLEMILKASGVDIPEQVWKDVAVLDGHTRLPGPGPLDGDDVMMDGSEARSGFGMDSRGGRDDMDMDMDVDMDMVDPVPEPPNTSTSPKSSGIAPIVASRRFFNHLPPAFPSTDHAPTRSPSPPPETRQYPYMKGGSASASPPPSAVERSPDLQMGSPGLTTSPGSGSPAMGSSLGMSRPGAVYDSPYAQSTYGQASSSHPSPTKRGFPSPSPSSSQPTLSPQPSIPAPSSTAIPTPPRQPAPPPPALPSRLQLTSLRLAFLPLTLSILSHPAYSPSPTTPPPNLPALSVLPTLLSTLSKLDSTLASHGIPLDSPRRAAILCATAAARTVERYLDYHGELQRRGGGGGGGGATGTRKVRTREMVDAVEELRGVMGELGVRTEGLEEVKSDFEGLD